MHKQKTPRIVGFFCNLQLFTQASILIEPSWSSYCNIE